MSELYHARRRSKYKGGFKIVNGRKNNTPEYNHDYYVNNRDRILEDKRKKKGYNAFQNWLGLDEKDRLKTADKAKEQADRWREMDTELGTDLIRKYIWDSDNPEARKWFEDGIAIRDYGWGYSGTADSHYYKALHDYDKTPMGKVEKAINGAKSLAQDAKWAIEDAGATTMKAVNKAIDEADYQLWSLGDDIKKAFKRGKK